MAKQFVIELSESNEVIDSINNLSSIIDSKNYEELPSACNDIQKAFLNYELKANRYKENAIFDSLTGLQNRNSFLNYLDRIYNRNLINTSNAFKGFNLLMIDLDHFKLINDTYGHLVGDEVLRKSAEIIKDSTRPSDFSFRYGGEEFAIISPNSNHDEGLLISERIRKNIEDLLFTFEDSNFNITTSIGYIHILPKTEINLKEIIHLADSGLYHSKSLGRNKITGVKNNLKEGLIEFIN